VVDAEHANDGEEKSLEPEQGAGVTKAQIKIPESRRKQDGEGKRWNLVVLGHESRPSSRVKWFSDATGSVRTGTHTEVSLIRRALGAIPAEAETNGWHVHSMELWAQGETQTPLPISDLPF
jgi:hypothetical protein